MYQVASGAIRDRNLTALVLILSVLYSPSAEIYNNGISSVFQSRCCNEGILFLCFDIIVVSEIAWNA